MRTRLLPGALPLLLMAVAGLPAIARSPEKSGRAEAENRFIERLKSWPGTTVDDWEVDITGAETYRDSMLILPGKNYQIPHVSSTTYHAYDEDGNVYPLVDSGFPAESLANIFLLPLDESREIPLDITFITHDYGSKTRIETTVDKFVSLCQSEGCEVYFGVEDIKSSGITCSLFLYNRAKGYDHVVKLDCDPVAVIDGDGAISARVGLYVPADNVESLYQRLPEGKSAARQELERQMEYGK